VEETKKDDDFAFKWYRVRNRVKEQFGQRPDLNSLLFVIGMNEVGMIKETWEKEDKQNLMHVAICKLLSEEGYYKYMGDDEEGWPHYEQNMGMPTFNIKEQEELLKRNIVKYFDALDAQI
jgi:hypothetical protein